MPLPLLIPVVLGGLGAAYGVKKIFKKVKEVEEAERKEDERVYEQEKGKFILDRNSLVVFNLPESRFENVDEEPDDTVYGGTVEKGFVDYPCASIYFANETTAEAEIVLGVYFREHGFDIALCCCAALRRDVDVKSQKMQSEIWEAFSFLGCAYLIKALLIDGVEGEDTWKAWYEDVRGLGYSAPKTFTRGDGREKDKERFFRFLRDGTPEVDNDRCITEILEYYKKERGISLPEPVFYDYVLMW